MILLLQIFKMLVSACRLWGRSLSPDDASQKEPIGGGGQETCVGLRLLVGMALSVVRLVLRSTGVSLRTQSVSEVVYLYPIKISRQSRLEHLH